MGVSAARTEVVAKLSGGSLEQAIYLSEEDVWENRMSLFSFLKKPALHLNELLEKTVQDHKRANLVINQLETIALDLACANDPLLDFTHSDQATLLKQIASQKPRAFWLRAAASAQDARGKLTTPVNKKILIHDLFNHFI